jgi:hypothetical protein
MPRRARRSAQPLGVMIQASYTPWRPRELLKLKREIVAVNWREGLTLEVSESARAAPTLVVEFRLARAFQGIDEGYRLRDIPMGDALIYFTRESPYLAAFREGAAGTMDNFPLIHWIVASSNQCVDVLCESEPTVTWAA